METLVTPAQRILERAEFVATGNECDGCGLGATMVIDNPHLPIIRELLELVEKQREALKISRDANAVSVCFRGKHVKQLDGSVKYELLPTYHQTAKEKADEALGLTDETLERLGKE